VRLLALERTLAKCAKVNQAEPSDALEVPAHKPELWWVRRPHKSLTGFAWFVTVAKNWSVAREQFQISHPHFGTTVPKRAKTLRLHPPT
jgi:hypothetical protein